MRVHILTPVSLCISSCIFHSPLAPLSVSLPVCLYIFLCMSLNPYHSHFFLCPSSVCLSFCICFSSILSLPLFLFYLVSVSVSFLSCLCLCFSSILSPSLFLFYLVSCLCFSSCLSISLPLHVRNSWASIVSDPQMRQLFRFNQVYSMIIKHQIC